MGRGVDEAGYYWAYWGILGDRVRLVVVDRYCVGELIVDHSRWFGIEKE